MFHRVSNNIYYKDHDEMTDRPTVGYIRGEKFSLMVESGNSENNIKEIYEDLAMEGLKKPDFAVITHSHWDHSFGISYLDAVTIACDKTNSILENMSTWQWSSEKLAKYVKDDKISLFCEPHIRLEYTDFEKIKVKAADISFKDEMTIDLGNKKCIFKNIISPHTDDCVIVYVPEEKVIFLGDAIYEELVGNEWIPHSDKLSELINELESLDFNIAIEGHFAPKTKLELITTLKAKL